MSKMNSAHRFGNHSMITQLQLILESYSYEIGVRNEKLLNDMQSKGKQFKSIIDIQ